MPANLHLPVRLQIGDGELNEIGHVEIDITDDGDRHVISASDTAEAVAGLLRAVAEEATKETK